VRPPNPTTRLIRADSEVNRVVSPGCGWEQIADFD